MHHHHEFNVEYEIMEMYYISNFIREFMSPVSQSILKQTHTHALIVQP